MTVRLLLALGLALAGAGGVTAESLDAPALQRRLDETLAAHPTARRTTVALKVVDLATGETLYDRGGDRLLTPASNLKIYVSACALNLFGPDHRFQTVVRADGPIVDGTLRGNLRLIGGGDAMLSSDDLAKLADRVVNELGVRRISGDVAVDNSRYASRLKGPGWMWDDEPAHYNMSITPLMVDFNVLTVKLTPSASGPQAALAPPADYPPIERIEPADQASRAKIVREPFAEPLRLIGAKLDKSAEQRLTMHAPAAWIAALFRRMLVDRGVEFTTAATRQSIVDARGATCEIVHEGPTLAETIKHFHDRSENAVGEVLLHEIAVSRGVKQPNWSDGSQATSDWLVETAKLEPGSFRLVDGSGLSRYNLISADSSVRLLKHLQQSDDFEVFFQSLPTSKVKLNAAELAGAEDKSTAPRVAAKGGSMTSVSTMSGYLRTLDDRWLAFSLLANGFSGSNKPVLDLRRQVWRELVRYQP